MRRPTCLSVLVLVLTLTACERVPTSIVMERSIDLIARFDPSLAGRNVVRFRTGFNLDAPWVTRATADGRARMPAAGSESPPCNDGRSYRLIRDTNFVFVEGVGDTGFDDISDDRNCSCDSHLGPVEFRGLRVEFEGGTIQQFEVPLGKADFCPNTLDDLHVGGRDFGGEVDASVNLTLEVRDGRLMLDTRYTLISVPAP